jgi:hypothetical protein
MGQEGDNQRCVEVFDRQLRRTGAEASRGEVEQQLEAERICLAALRTITPLTGHVVAQEAGDKRGELRHAALSPTSISAAEAISVIISGVAWRYQ